VKIVFNGDELEVTSKAVLIRKTGLANAMASGVNGERTIPLQQITAIGFKRGGMFSLGFIQFSYPGGKQFRGGLIEATQDPDAFVFRRELNDEVEAFKTEAESRMEQARLEGAGSPATISQQLAELVVMRNTGDISIDEFQLAKDRLLGVS
jgi:hypothetical protein